MTELQLNRQVARAGILRETVETAGWRDVEKIISTLRDTAVGQLADANFTEFASDTSVLATAIQQAVIAGTCTCILQEIQSALDRGHAASETLKAQEKGT